MKRKSRCIFRHRALAVYGFAMCYQEWMLLENRNEELLFGYDFSQGYTSLEKDAGPAREK